MVKDAACVTDVDFVRVLVLGVDVENLGEVFGFSELGEVELDVVGVSFRGASLGSEPEYTQGEENYRLITHPSDTVTGTLHRHDFVTHN